MKRFTSDQYTFEEIIKYFGEMKFTYKGRNYDLNVSPEEKLWTLFDRTDFDNTHLPAHLRKSTVIKKFKNTEEVLNGGFDGKSFEDILSESIIDAIG